MSMTITFDSADGVRRAYTEINPTENLDYPIGEQILMDDINEICKYFMSNLESEDPAAAYSMILRRQINNCEYMLKFLNFAFDTYSDCLDLTNNTNASDFVSDQTLLYNKILLHKFNVRRRLALFNFLRGR